MIDVKTKKEIELMRQSGRILSQVLSKVLASVKPGVSELELDKLAESLIKEKGGEPGFKKVKGYKHSICVSVNDVVVHGIPTDYRLKEGNLIGIDCGVFYKGFHTDMAETLVVTQGPVVSFPPASVPRSSLTSSNELRAGGSPSTGATPQSDVYAFLETGKRALFAGINEARAGNRVGHISKAIQDIVEGGGYSVVHFLVGHGVGKALHEEPEIPGFLAGKIEDTPLLKSGMTIAIEVIYNMGKPDVEYSGSDDWTISTLDGSLSGLFERTILVAGNNPELLTRLSGDDVNDVKLYNS